MSTWTLPGELTSAGEARALIREPLEQWDLASMVPTTQLLVSELVTNAIRYAHGPVTLRLVLERTLICEVLDSSAGAAQAAARGQGRRVRPRPADRQPALAALGRPADGGRQDRLVRAAVPAGLHPGHPAQHVSTGPGWPGPVRSGGRPTATAVPGSARRARLVSCLIDSLPFRIRPIRCARRATVLSWVTRISVSP